MDKRDKLPNFAAGRPVCPPRTPGSAADKEQNVAYKVSASIRAALYTGITQADAGLGTHPYLIAVREIIHGTDGPHAVIATTLFRNLPERRRKILAFADGRQEAAFFAW